MINKLKTAIKNILLGQRISLSKTTDRELLLAFLASVKPVVTNHALIRIGGETDGGYLVPDDIENIDACFSPGVSEIAEFENELTRKGIRCFLADYSVERPPIENPLFDFEKKYLGSKDDVIFMTLESWMKSKFSGENDLILQMDIEGAEYPVIFDTSSETLKRFRIIVIEFHELDALFNKKGFELVSLTFAKLLKDFDVVHIHPNNCDAPVECDGIAVPPVMEFTFLRKDRISRRSFVPSFPNKLDRTNMPGKPDFALPKDWY